jgi:hypothetical protein
MGEGIDHPGRNRSYGNGHIATRLKGIVGGAIWRQITWRHSVLRPHCWSGSPSPCWRSSCSIRPARAWRAQILAGALVAVAWLVVDGRRRGVPPGRLAARALVGAVPVLALFSFAALGIGGHEAFDDDATMTGAVVGAIALIAAVFVPVADQDRALEF